MFYVDRTLRLAAVTDRVGQGDMDKPEPIGRHGELPPTFRPYKNFNDYVVLYDPENRPGRLSEEQRALLDAKWEADQSSEVLRRKPKEVDT